MSYKCFLLLLGTLLSALFTARNDPLKQALFKRYQKVEIVLDY